MDEKEEVSVCRVGRECVLSVHILSQIERLMAQLSEQEGSKKQQGEELALLQEQLQQLRKEEQEYKQKVGVAGVQAKVGVANSSLVF